MSAAWDAPSLVIVGFTAPVTRRRRRRRRLRRWLSETGVTVAYAVVALALAGKDLTPGSDHRRSHAVVVDALCSGREDGLAICPQAGEIVRVVRDRGDFEHSGGLVRR